MRLKLLTLLIFAIAIISCKDSPNTPELNDSITIEESSTLKLNNGKKWIANIETHEGVTKMDSIIKVFESNTTKNYSALGKSLSEQTSLIIQKCNMKGEPHNQLHIVLVPMLDEISILKEAEMNENMESALYKLDSLTTTYFKHFKTQ